VHTTLRMIAAAFLLLAAAAGCNLNNSDQAASADGVQGTVAVIDLNVIFKEFGRDKQLVAALEQHGTSLKKQLGVIKASYEQELVKRKEKIGTTPTQEQKQYLANAQRQATVSLNQEKKKANVSLNQYRARLIRDFRSEVKPFARKVAGERGLSIIITKNEELVFDHETAVDITEAVIERMRAEPSSPGLQ